jgi:hypothetical protein
MVVARAQLGEAIGAGPHRRQRRESKLHVHTGLLLRHALEVDVIVGVDFGAPQRARDQRKKIVAIAAHARR